MIVQQFYILLFCVDLIGKKKLIYKTFFKLNFTQFQIQAATLSKPEEAVLSHTPPFMGKKAMLETKSIIGTKARFSN